MNSEILLKLDADLKKQGTSLKEIELSFPKIYESLMPLSITGVSPRTYFYWKESGLIVNSASTDDERSWVRINLIEYVWIKIIQIMREFGIPFETIKETKNLLFSNFLKEIIDKKEEMYQGLQNDAKLRKDKLQEFKDNIDLVSEELSNIPIEFEKYYTLIGAIVTELLLLNDNGSLIVTKNEGEFDIDYYSVKALDEFKNLIRHKLELPHINIPLRKLIEDFFNNPRCDKFIDSYELLNLKEKSVIDAIRKKDFKQIIIKQDNKNESIIIEVEKDGDIMDQKAKEIKRILGMNEYSEVTITFRNDKHLYFKNKTRI